MLVWAMSPVGLDPAAVTPPHGGGCPAHGHQRVTEASPRPDDRTLGLSHAWSAPSLPWAGRCSTGGLHAELSVEVAQTLVS